MRLCHLPAAKPQPFCRQSVAGGRRNPVTGLAAQHDRIISGHIHRASLLQRDGMVYANDGDWVESLIALSEEMDGSL